VFDTGHGRKTDAADAHSVAVVALRTPNLTVVRVDDDLVALRLLVDRRDELGRTRTQKVNRLHRLLLELIPGGAKRFLTAAQAHALLDSVAPTDVAGRVRHQLAAGLLDEIVVLDKKMNDSDKTLRKAVTATGTGLLGLYGIGPRRHCPDTWRRRRRGPLRHPRAVRVLERHRTP
jgi:transposase